MFTWRYQPVFTYAENLVVSLCITEKREKMGQAIDEQVKIIGKLFRYICAGLQYFTLQIIYQVI